MKFYTKRHIERTDRVKLNVGTAQCTSLLCTSLHRQKDCLRSVRAQLYKVDMIWLVVFLPQQGYRLIDCGSVVSHCA